MYMYIPYPNYTANYSQELLIHPPQFHIMYYILNTATDIPAKRYV